MSNLLGKLVRILWLDSIGFHGWASPEQVDAYLSSIEAPDSSHIVETVGWLIRQGDRFYITASSRAYNDDVHTPFAIPIPAVLSITELEPTSDADAALTSLHVLDALRLIHSTEDDSTT